MGLRNTDAQYEKILIMSIGSSILCSLLLTQVFKTHFEAEKQVTWRPVHFGLMKSWQIHWSDFENNII